MEKDRNRDGDVSSASSHSRVSHIVASVSTLQGPGVRHLAIGSVSCLLSLLAIELAVAYDN